MITLAEMEKLALDLSDSDRAALASHLLRSLPPALEDDDEGIAEAMRRDAEMDADPSLEITQEQLDELMKNQRG